MGMKKNKKVNVKQNPKSSKTPRIESNVQSNDNHKISWRFSDVDKSGDWSFDISQFEAEDLKEIISKLANRDSMTWSELKNKRHHQNL